MQMLQKLQMHAFAYKSMHCCQRIFFNAFKWAGITGPTFGKITGMY